MSQERKQILEMLAEGKISVEEAEKLLELINEEPKIEKKRFVDTFIYPKSNKNLYIQVIKHPHKNINVCFPLSTLQILSKTGKAKNFMKNKLRIGQLPDDVSEEINVDLVLKMIENNESGEILNYQSGDGEEVKIFIK